MNVLTIVPARGGSKRVPGKNLRLLGDRPLLDWTLQAIDECNDLKHATLSSDSVEILERCRGFSKTRPLERPAYLATDTVSTVDVVNHIIEQTPGRFDLVMVLQPTSPFRTSRHITQALAIANQQNDFESLVSVCKNEGAMNHLLVKEGNLIKRPFAPEYGESERTQDQNTLYRLNGAIYLAAMDFFKQTGKLLSEKLLLLEMPWLPSIDIDTETDLAVANCLNAHRNELQILA